MSLYLEESPLSDNKMDISESPESNVSPENETETNIEAPLNYIQDDGDNIGIKTINADIIQKPISYLDNRIQLPPSTNQISRTLANSHPLMSPTGADTDSEEQNYVPDIKCHNFPDVIPCNERLQSASVNKVLVRNTLNSCRGKAISNHTQAGHNISPNLRAHSPDLLSSESDIDASQYHASVGNNFQAVALVSNTRNVTANNDVLNTNKLGSTGGVGCEDISSLDSISNHSFEDDDIEHNLASLSPSSSLMEGLGDDDNYNDNDCENIDGNILDANTPTPNQGVPVILNESGVPSLPQYTAVEEHRNSRNWQKITLPDGQLREIDMRVIEPYKRVLSHGGYLKAGGQNAIVMFCACHLPDHSRTDYNYVMDNLFLYVVKTLEQLVTEDYVLIYLHGGSSRRNMPPFPWLKKCYQLLDHRLRKSLKNMYLVHPTFWIKSIVWMTRPFVSAKFWRKLVYVKSLEELNKHVAVERAAIPEKVKLYDAKHN